MNKKRGCIILQIILNIFDQELNRYMELQATNGQRVLANIIFSHALRYFKDSCLKEINDGAIAREPIDAMSVQWVITVPAIWRQSAKQFMRDSAIKVYIIIIQIQFVQIQYIFKFACKLEVLFLLKYEVYLCRL